MFVYMYAYIFQNLEFGYMMKCTGSLSIWYGQTKSMLLQVRSAEHAAKIARLEAEEWRFHAQSLQASLER